MTPADPVAGVSLVERVEETIASGEIQLPPLPEILVKLRELLADEKARPREVCALLEAEPAATSVVFRMANSAAYAGLRQIADLEAAVARLGLRRIQSIVTTLLMKSQYGKERSSRRSVPGRLWDHAVATAMASRALSAMTGQGDREEAYLAGLLHDCGRLLVLDAVEHLEGQDGVPEIGPALIDEMMDALGPKVGARALRAWTMPEAVCDAAAHAYDADADGMPRSALVVQVASAIARKIGAHPKPDPKLNLALVPATERLKIGAVALTGLLVDVEDEFLALKKML